MNRNEYEDLLADYLGDELDPAARAAFESYLAEHADAREEARELRATLDELARLRSSPDIPIATSSAMSAQAPAAKSRASATRRFLSGALKAAAVLMFGVLIGRATAPTPAPTAGPSESPSGETRALARAEGVHPGWIELARQLDANGGSLAGQLRFLANLRH